MWVLMNALSKLSLGALGNLTKILQAENAQKVDQFEPIHRGQTNIHEKWSVIFEQTINHLCFGYVRLNQLKYYSLFSHAIYF